MPRKPRCDAPEGIYHILSRGNDKQDIYRDDEDRQEFLRILAATKGLAPFKLFAYCLMSNHFHFLVQTGTQPTSFFMHRVLGAYSQYFNQHHGHTGHVFQDRYKAFLCTRDAYLFALVRYIHLNPVRAGLVSNPEDWRWSGHNELLGRIGPMLLDRSSAIAMLTAEDGTPAEEATPDEVEPSETPREKLEALAQTAAAGTRVQLEMMRGPRRLRRLTPVRRLFANLALKNGYTIAEIARFLNRAQSSVAGWLEPPGPNNRITEGQAP